MTRRQRTVLTSTAREMGEIALNDYVSRDMRRLIANWKRDIESLLQEESDENETTDAASRSTHD